MDTIGSVQKDELLKQQQSSMMDTTVQKEREENKSAAGVGAVVQENVQRAVQEKKSMNEIVAGAVHDYDKKLKMDFKYSGMEHEIENYTIKELIDLMEKDTHKKHAEFQKMEQLLKKLYSMSDEIKKESKTGKNMGIIDYRDLIKLLDQTARIYQTTHNRMHITSYGRKRLRISSRIIDIMSGFRKYVSDMESGKIKDLTKQVEDADIEGIMRTDSMSDAKKGETISDWLKNGGKYRAAIRKIIKDEELDKKDKDAFIRIMADKKGNFRANRVAVSEIIREFGPKSLLGLSYFEKALEKYLENEINSSEETQVKIFGDTTEFRRFIDITTARFLAENGAKLNKAEDRKKIYAQELGIDITERAFFSRDDVNELLINSTDEAFRDELLSLKEQAADNKELVEQLLDSLDYSYLSRDEVRDAVWKDLKALAVYGSEKDIASAVGDRRDYIKFLCPEAAEAEERIKLLMESHSIPRCDRDVFVKYVSNGAVRAEAVARAKYHELNKRAYTYGENLRACSKAARASSFGKMKLTEATWKLIEEMKNNMGTMDSAVFKDRISRIVENNEWNSLYSQPDITYARFLKDNRKEKPKRGVGFEQRILGDLFLESNEIEGILTDSEKEFFKKNLIRRMAPSESVIADLDELPTGAIRKTAGLLKSNLVSAKGFIAEIRQEHKEENLMNEILLEIALSTENLDVSNINDLIIRVEDRVSWEKKMDEEKEKMLRAVSLEENDVSSLDQKTLKKFRNHLKHLKAYKNGRYSLFAERLLKRGDFYRFFMAGSERDLEVFLDRDIEKKLGNALDGILNSSASEGLIEEYLDQKFDLIYDGKIKGDITVFKNDIALFEKVFLSENKTTKKKIEKNMVDAFSEIEKEVLGRSKADYAKSFTVLRAAGAAIKNLYKSREGMKTLSDKTALKARIRKCYDNYSENYNLIMQVVSERADNRDSVFYGYDSTDKKLARTAGQNVSCFLSDLKEKPFTMSRTEMEARLSDYIANFEFEYKKQQKYTEEHGVKEEDIERVNEALGKKAKRENIRQDRDEFLQLDRVRGTIEEILKRKALVSMGSDRKNALSRTNQTLSRDYVETHLSSLGLDPFLVDCLVEKNVNRINDSDINLHAVWLDYVSEILSVPDEGEEKIGEDERKLLIVNVYRHIEDFKDSEGKYKADRKTIKGEWYKTFRKNYKILQKLENTAIPFPSLSEERSGLCRDLRALLSTGIGIKDQDGSAESSFEELGKKAETYISYVGSFMTLADKVFKENEGYGKASPAVKEKYLLSARQYFHEAIMRNLNGDDPSFKEDSWIPELNSFASDPLLMRYILRDSFFDVVAQESFHKENRNFIEAATGRDMIDALIKEKGSMGQRKKYEKLKPHEKELFCFGLMIMEKSAIGFDRGTSSVLSSPSHREKEVGDRLKELTKYMMGENYDLKVDYSQAYYKLLDLGLNFFGNDKEAFSTIAYDKAMEFVLGIEKKIEESRNALTKEDKKRLSDGISSIYEAALLGKKQIDEVDELKKKPYTVSSVREKLLEYARADGKKMASYNGGDELGLRLEEADIDGISTVIKDTKLNKIKNESRDRSRVLKRLEKMDENETLKLIAILQNRAALDISTKDSKRHVDEEKREELRLMFAEEEESRAFKRFTSPSACMQALISAISFQVKDDKHLEGSRLTEKDFEGASFKRKGMADWSLLGRAIDFLDELKKERVARFAVRNAPNYIPVSGNEKAIAAYEKLLGKKEEKDVGQDTLEDFLKKEAEKDKTSKDNPEAKLALAGYNALSESQKRLFIKVLSRRDFLDISKKNLYLNMVSSKYERGYVNETGRFRLIDEFIETSVRGNRGVSLTENSYKDALKSLLSTQVDDTVDFGKEERVKDVLSGEKYFLFKRDTAIDWKLFTRALQFVNRASYELEMREGNEELYRSAGKFTEFGDMNMDYSILRRNIHSTGNQYLRFGIRRGKKLAVDQVKDLKLFGEGGPSVSEIADFVMNTTKVIAPGLNKELENFKKALLSEEERRQRRTDDLPGVLKTDDPVKYLKEQLKGKIQNALTGTVLTAGDSTLNEVGSLVISSVTKGVKVEEIGTFLKKKILDETPAALKDKRISSLIGDAKVDQVHGDFRDQIFSIVEGYKKVNEAKDKVRSTAGTIQDIVNDAATVEVIGSVESLFSKAVSVVISEEAGEKVDDALKFELGTVYVTVKDFVDQRIAEFDMGEDYKKKILEMPQLFIDGIEDKAKEMCMGILKSCFDKDTFESISEAYGGFEKIGDAISENSEMILGKFKKAKVMIECFDDIAVSVKNKRLLKKGEKRADSDETRQEDEETLERAKKVQSPAQQAMNKNTVAEHSDMQQLSKKTADTIQDLAIADDVIQVLLEVGEELAEDLGGFGAAGMVKEAIRAGADFALYVTRCLKDKSMLRQYYTETEKGSGEVRTLKDSYGSLSGGSGAGEAELEGVDVLDIVRTGKGYESMEELVTDTGMKMASSIAYCASRYNPIKRTKIMATTVMVVLGMKDSIGKTDNATIAMVFDKMKAA